MDLKQAISQAWADADSNAQARDNLKSIAQADQDVMDELMRPHLDAAIARVIGDAKRAERRAIWTRPTGPDVIVSRLAKEAANTLYDMRLPSGQRLGDAFREDVAAARVVYQENADANQQKANFLGRVLSLVDEGKRVRDCVSLEQLEGFKVAA